MSMPTPAILSGIRVLDFGRYVAGPYCATLLGYLGADVIRIERRDGGEDRYIAPISASGEGGVFFQTACNKRSLTLDPTHPQSREVIRRLVASADVVVANLPAVQLRAFGLDYATLCTIRADIILASQSAFGDRGPYAERGGFDGVGQAMSGAMYISGTPAAPVKAAAPYVDFATAVMSAFGTVAALLHRQNTGAGQEVQATLLGTALAAFGSHLVEQSVTQIDRVGTGNRVQTSAPSDVFATTDGHLLTHVVGNGLFRRWAALMGNAERWLQDPRYANDAVRGEHSADILAQMRLWCAARSTQAAVDELVGAGIPAGPILRPREALADPQVAAMQFMATITDFPGLPRPALVPNLPLRFSATPGGVKTRPPLLGEHTEAILNSLGFDAQEIAGLRAAAVI